MQILKPKTALLKVQIQFLLIFYSQLHEKKLIVTESKTEATEVDFGIIFNELAMRCCNIAAHEHKSTLSLIVTIH
jgi:hypothetical protein